MFLRYAWDADFYPKLKRIFYREVTDLQSYEWGHVWVTPIDRTASATDCDTSTSKHQPSGGVAACHGATLAQLFRELSKS